MNLKKYFYKINKKITKIDKYITNPAVYDDIINPFLSPIPKTYVWIEENKYKKL